MKRGFTLIEVLLVIAFIAILAVAIILAINPGRQFAKIRDTQRSSDLNTILNSIVQNMTDNNGNFVCNGQAYNLATSWTVIASSTNAQGGDLAPCLVPTYMVKMPVDPKVGIWVSSTNYYTGYEIYRDPTSSRLFLRASNAELTGGQPIELSR